MEGNQPDHDPDETRTERTADLRQIANHSSYREVYRACHIPVIGHE